LFCRFTGWRSRLSRSNLVAVAVATLHLAKEINYFGPLPLHQFLRRKRRQFFRCTPSDTFWQLRSTSMSRECWHLRSKRVWLSASQGRRHFQSAISSSTQAFRAGLACSISRPQAGSSRVLAFHERRHLKRRHFHGHDVQCVSCVTCVSVMCHKNICHVSCVIGHVVIGHVSMCHVSRHHMRCHMSYGIVSCKCHVASYIICLMSVSVCHVSCVMCRIMWSYVMCHVSYVICHMPYVMCHGV
jgi:hypothetical protein